MLKRSIELAAGEIELAETLLGHINAGSSSSDYLNGVIQFVGDSYGFKQEIR